MWWTGDSVWLLAVVSSTSLRASLIPTGMIKTRLAAWATCLAQHLVLHSDADLSLGFLGTAAARW